MEELNFNRLEQAFDKCCVRVAQTDPELIPFAKELVAFAELHPARLGAIEKTKMELRVHYTKRKSYRDHNRFKRNAQLIILTVAEMYMRGIKYKRDLDNESTMTKVTRQLKEQTRNDVAQLIREVPADGETSRTPTEGN